MTKIPARENGDEIVAKKIRAYTALMIFIIIVAAITAIAITKGQSVNPVRHFKMTGNTDTSISMQWDRVKKADGYQIYTLNNDTNQYEQIAVNKGIDNCKYEMTDISGASIYSVKVLAYRNFMNKTYYSSSAKEYTVYSKPSAPNISSFSGGKGVLSMEWDDYENLNGYDIQYSKSNDFSSCETQEITDGETRNYTVRDLNPGDLYYVRVRSYITVDGKRIYGKWSEVSQTEIYDKDLNIESVDPNKPMIAFTFDDGPAFDYDSSNSTERILDVLEKYNAHATFFMVGERVNSETTHLLQREIALGCELGNHTYAHNHYGREVTASDISKASNRIKKYCGKAPTMFRCPGGNVTSAIRKECKKEGMPLAYWSVDTEDWKTKDAKKIRKNIINHVYDGAIVLMHDIYPTTADAVEKVVPELIEKGYQIVTVSEMIAAKTGDLPKAGTQYVDYKTVNNNTK